MTLLQELAQSPDTSWLLVSFFSCCKLLRVWSWNFSDFTHVATEKKSRRLGKKKSEKGKKSFPKSLLRTKKEIPPFYGGSEQPFGLSAFAELHFYSSLPFFRCRSPSLEKTRKSQLAASPGAGSWGSQFRVFFCKNRNKSCSSSPNRSKGLSVISIAANWQFSSPLCLQVVELGWKLFFFIGFQ